MSRTLASAIAFSLMIMGTTLGTLHWGTRPFPTWSVCQARQHGLAHLGSAEAIRTR